MMKRISTLIFILLTLSLLFSQEFERYSAEDFKSRLDELIKEEADFALLDIRTLPEYQFGHIEGAQLIDFYGKDFVQKLNEMAKSKTYLIYCRSGNRTSQALQIMKQLEFDNVIDLENGIVSWLEAGFEVVK
ncbi:MAG: rhodanese-like domain-containing protein [Candidatus Cloacimonetes bacterium]|nr:rhodanese-like domain-containing protein [Candidatus Cloacimonadota bacterium]MCF7813146.1 rhodanese-like domain-containing protein [Candidatus Cloacimonadota bacterium]MCF7867594.1 rhodanese-like domain-containing protein [Candidatus Cloacimonadota bacterium]MCF7883131.1 rhodanese-like domain-containing protein [Candidatus Cloacimonadota bacterium]